VAGKKAPPAARKQINFLVEQKSTAGILIPLTAVGIGLNQTKVWWACSEAPARLALRSRRGFSKKSLKVV
jgi:hypothetical protein